MEPLSSVDSLKRTVTLEAVELTYIGYSGLEGMEAAKSCSVSLNSPPPLMFQALYLNRYC